jgi:hypothetical protein
MLFKELSDRLVAVVLQMGVVSKHLVCHMLGYLLVHACHHLLLGSS